MDFQFQGTELAYFYSQMLFSCEMFLRSFLFFIYLFIIYLFFYFIKIEVMKFKKSFSERYNKSKMRVNKLCSCKYSLCTASVLLTTQLKRTRDAMI